MKDAMRKPTIYKQHKSIREGRTNIEDDIRAERLSTFPADENVEDVPEIVRRDR